MTRLAAQENLEYYPTQEAIRPLIRSYLKFPAKGTNCLDPCCGPGDAFAEICPEQKLFGIEYHPVRADEAKSRLYKVLSSPLENCTISNRAFGFVHCNPPYDWAYGGKVRYEELFLARSTQYLSLNGVLELLVPTTLFKYRGPAVLKHLYENYTDLLFLRYPSPEFDKFKQLVIFGVRKPREKIIVDQDFLATKAKKIYTGKLSVLEHQSKPLYKVPQLNPGEVKIFRSSYYSEEIAALESQTVSLLANEQEGASGKMVAPTYLGKVQLAFLAVNGNTNGLIQENHYLLGQCKNEEIEEVAVDEDEEFKIVKKVSRTVFYCLTKEPNEEGSRITVIE